MTQFDLGRHRRPVSTGSPEAQAWFDVGLNWCYAFNHEEGLSAFERAIDYDADCAMAYWGVAYAVGPFYNLTWQEMGEAEARQATERGYAALQLARRKANNAAESGSANTLERALIEALGRRFQAAECPSPLVFAQWDDAYAAAMRGVHADFPHDHDVTALFVEALMMRTVRRLWDLKTGLPAANSDVVEALGVCERAIASADAAGRDPHPALVHLHIHLLEMSTMPERARRSADVLGRLCPDGGHMNHMPGHIHVLCGQYEKAKQASLAAIAANERYRAQSTAAIYYLLSCCHDLHLLMFTCMFLGQLAPARDAADGIRRLISRAIIALPGRPKFTQTVEGYHAMKSHVLVRFGRWQEIIDEPMVEEPELYVLTTAMQHYSKGVAHAALQDFAKAEEERRLFHRHMAGIPPTRRFLSNPTTASLAVGAALLDGEIAYHRGRHELAFDHLRRAVELDDNLSYTEPWAWMHPPRHALAALLLDRGHLAEAEQVYRDDLGMSGRVQRCAQHPENIWALHGLVECLSRQGEVLERAHLQVRLDEAMAKADVRITSSCLCRPVEAPDCCH
ncbi:hypothetical protein SAMN07250955_12214 [Arboricoccus pini]|uniref:Tetratricopeptide repeat-containing protein n=1 Tax=Arboricoccus pini TaxID=1963835 RepID=A0A212S3U5_9PROT|nr:hypothetical protein [Arboricoccus pini]SNB79688.1 hypothetical protein SAMN07250955_12214 [Arboricoccus pini]